MLDVWLQGLQGHILPYRWVLLLAGLLLQLCLVQSLLTALAPCFDHEGLFDVAVDLRWCLCEAWLHSKSRSEVSTKVSHLQCQCQCNLVRQNLFSGNSANSCEQLLMLRGGL